MVTKYEKANRSKLLAAVMIMAVIFAGAAIVLQAEEGSSAIPEKPAAAPFGVKEGAAYSVDSGVYTISGDVTFTLSTTEAKKGTYGTVDKPLDIRFDITSGKVTFTATEAVDVFMNYTASADNKSMFNGDITVDGKVTLRLEVSADSGLATADNKDIHIFDGSDVVISNGAKIVITQDASVNGVSWYNGTLDVSGKSTFEMDGANGVAGVASTFDDSYLNIKNPNAATFNLYGTLTKSSVNVTGSSTKNVVNMYNVNMDKDSKIEAPNATIGVYESCTVNGTAGASIIANKIAEVEARDDGNVTINGMKITANLAAPGDGAGKFVLSGVTFEGKSGIDEGAEVEAGTGGITISEKATLAVAGELSAGSSSVTNNGLVTVTHKDAVIPNMNGTGSIDTSAISADAELKGDIYDVNSYGVGQTITVTGDTTLLAGTQLTIKGKLVVNEGVTLKIEDGAQLIINGQTALFENNGTVIVESDVKSGDKNKEGTFTTGGGFVVNSKAVLTNNGTITLGFEIGEDGECNDVLIITGSTIENNGIIEIYEDNIVSIDNSTLNNNENSELNVYGTIGGTINNKGSVVIAVIIDDETVINMNGEDAEVSIINATMKDTDILTITNVNFTKKNNDFDNGESKVVITATGNATNTASNAGTVSVTVSGIQIKVVTSTDGEGQDKEYYKGLDVSGPISVTGESTNENDTVTASIEVAITSSKSSVSDELTLMKNVTLKISGDLNVSGTVTKQKDANIVGAENTSAITVTGIVVSDEDLKSKIVMNAAMYSVTSGATKTYYYTTIYNAISADAKAITVYGNVSILEDITVPAGVTLTQDKNSVITVGSDSKKDVTVAVAKDGKIDQKTGATITVDGTLYIEDKATGIKKNPSVTSEVMSETAGDLRYTNLAMAIAAATGDDVVIKLNGPVTIKSDLTIPSNVTVDTNEQDFTVEGATLTVDGTLFLNDSKYEVKNVSGNVTKEGKVILTGYIESTKSVGYNNKAYPAGAYYSITTGTKDAYYITTVKNASAIIMNVDDQTVNVYGENQIGDVSFVGTEDDIAYVNFNGKTVAGTVTIKDAVVRVNEQSFTGTVSSAEGSVYFKDAEFKGTITSAPVEDVMTMTVTGTATSEKDDTYDVTFDGTVVVKDMIAPEITVKGDAKFTGTATKVDTVNIEGTLVVDNAASVQFGVANVIGTLNVSVATDSKTAGSATIGTLYVGISKDDLVKSLNASATIVGKPAFTTMYVASGSNVDSELTKDVPYTTYYIENSIWMTAYAKGTVNISDVNKAPVGDAEFDGWNDADGKSVDDATVGSNGYDKVYALVDYNIYSVTIIADNGIGTVAIDGNVLYKESNKFVATGLTAGPHTITYEMKNGFEGKITIMIDGKDVSDGKFTLSGKDDSKIVKIGDDSYYNSEINVSGSMPIDYTQGGSSGNGMSLVEILLIVLVVMVVILAIVVILRMMRS